MAYEMNHCATLERFSLLDRHFAFFDTKDYLADGLFIAHEVRVRFGAEYVRDGFPYRIVFCRVRKRDADKFVEAMRELPRKMLLFGHTDYLDLCDFERMADAVWLPPRG